MEWPQVIFLLDTVSFSLDAKRETGRAVRLACAFFHSLFSPTCPEYRARGFTKPRGNAMTRFSNLTTVASVLVAVALMFFFTACDSNPPGDTGGNQPPTAVAQASPQDTTTNTEVTFDASGSTDPDDDAGSLTYAWEFGDETSGSGETTNHAFDAAGEYTAELSVSDGASAKTDEVTVSIAAPKPDSVAITYRPQDTDGTVLEDAHVTDGDVFGTGEFTDSVAYSTDTREALAERDGYEDGSSTYTPNSSQTVEIELSEKTAEVTVKAQDLETEIELSSQLELSADGETVASGVAPLTTEVSVNVDELTVSAAEHEKDKEVYADTSDTFVLADSPVTVGQRRVAHCVNGLDNDGDDLTGIGKDENDNGFIDANDPGCTSVWDDGEKHVVYIKTRYGAGHSDTSFVSGHPDNWESRPGPFDPPEHITLAIGNIFLSSDVKISSNEDGESFTWRFSCGSKTSIADMAEDDPSVDGWYSPVLLGITPLWFSESTDCEMTALHQAFVNDNPTDGNDDVIFGYPKRTGKTVFSWVYEPDHPALSNQRAGHAQTEADTDDDVDVTVRSTGYIKNVSSESQ
jgi:hypothetical protein